MTKKKRLFEMKKELKTIKKLLDKSDKCFDELKWGNAGHYIIIMNNGDEYIVGATTYDFPKINFNQIVYVCKFIRIVCGYYDTDIGYYREYHDFSYPSKVEKKYRVKNTIYTGMPY